MTSEMKVEIQGYQVLEKTVKEGGTSGRIYLPKEWINKRVKIVLLEPSNEEE